MEEKDRLEQIYDLIEGLYIHVTKQFAEQNEEIAGLRTQMGGLETGLRAEMGSLETGLRAEMGGLETRLRAEMTDMKTELRTEMADMKTELKTAITENGEAIRRLEKEVKGINDTLLRHDLDILMLKKNYVKTG